MMLGSFQRRKSTSGANTNGAPWFATAYVSPSVSTRIGSPQQAHELSTSADTFRSSSRPFTKGAAIASTAQAANASSPESKRRLCGVGAAVKG